MPLALVSFVCVLIVKHYQLNHWLLLPVSIGVLIGGTALSLGMPRAPARTPLPSAFVRQRPLARESSVH
jgi:hypothetical protein